MSRITIIAALPMLIVDLVSITIRTGQGDRDSRIAEGT